MHIYSWSAVEELRIVALIMAQNSCKCAEVVLKKILHSTTEIVLHKHFTESTNVIKMTWWLAFWERRMKCIRCSCKSRQHNSYSIEDNHLKSSQTARFFFYLNPIYRNTNLISNTTKLQEFSKFTKNASYPAQADSHNLT